MRIDAPLAHSWIELTGNERGTEIWVRLDTIVTVVEGHPDREAPSVVREARSFSFPGHPEKAPPPKPKPFTRVMTSHGTFQVRQTVDEIMDQIAEAIRLRQ